MKLNDRPILYFLPEWDDRVQQRYDFWNDKRDETSSKVYSHEIYGASNFDGILISKMLLDGNKKKMQDATEKGVHRHMNYDGLIFGDCGAYSYKDLKKPPYTNQEIADYYENLDFDLGVSVDHLCLAGNQEEWSYRRQITLDNAKELMEIHDHQGYSFKPIGSAQGWDPKSYYYSVEKLIEYGYDFIALGGLSNTPTHQIIDVLEFLQPLRRDMDIKFHLFGVARLKAIREFIELGVYSFDSASPLRYAWTGKKQNYKAVNTYDGYTAIRLPFVSRLRSKAYRRLVTSGMATKEEIEGWEFGLYGMLRDYEFGRINYTPDEIATEFLNFYRLFDGKIDPNLYDYYVRTLQDRPWEDCDCSICKEIGIEVMILRGNARNRRRGFHNTYVFYNLLQKIIENPEFSIDDAEDEDSDEQTSLNDFW